MWTGIENAEVPECIRIMDLACHVVHGTDRHAAGVETLAADSAQTSAFYELDFLSGGRKPDGSNPSGRPATDDNDHGRTRESAAIPLEIFLKGPFRADEIRYPSTKRINKKNR
jgi:hypothetical protein